MRFSPNGTYLATAGQDCEVVVWKVARTRTGPPDRDAEGGPTQGAAEGVEQQGSEGVPASGGPASVSSSGGPKTSEELPGSPRSEKEGGGHDAAGMPLLETTPFRRYKVGVWRMWGMDGEVDMCGW